MKWFVISMALLFSNMGAAQALIGPDSSWQEIQDGGYSIEVPNVWFGTYGVSLLNVCRNQSAVQTIAPIIICEKYSTGPEKKCLRSKEAFLAKPTAYEERQCVRYAAQHECVEWTMSLVEMTLVYQLTVRFPAGIHHLRGEMPKGKVAFLKEFSVPNCQN